jgi:hypothetical protein
MNLAPVAAQTTSQGLPSMYAALRHFDVGGSSLTMPVVSHAIIVLSY